MILWKVTMKARGLEPGTWTQHPPFFVSASTDDEATRQVWGLPISDEFRGVGEVTVTAWDWWKDEDGVAVPAEAADTKPIEIEVPR